MKKFLFLLLFILSPTLGLSEIGYKDLKVGMSWDSAEKICGNIPYDEKATYDHTFGVCEKYTKWPYPRVTLHKNDYHCNRCTVQLVSVLAGTYDGVFDKLVTTLTKKYGLPDYYFSANEMEMYNSGTINYLTVLFAEGTVQLYIKKNNTDEVSVSYTTKKVGNEYLSAMKEWSLNMDDF